MNHRAPMNFQLARRLLSDTSLPALFVFAAFLGICGPLASAVRGQTAQPEDIVLLLSSDGALQSSSWAGELAFVEYLNQHMPGRASTRLSIIQYSTAVTTRYNLTDSQTPATINTMLNGLSYDAGSTSLKAAVQGAINLFDAQSDPLNPKLIILLADHQANPVTQDISSAEISTLTADHIPLLAYEGGLTVIPSSYFQNVTSSTGGAIYSTNGTTYSSTTVGNTEAAQFLIDAAPYFNQGIPEPGALGLFAVGVVAISARRRRA
jgi:predicted outer membrane repeat protein